MRQKRIGKDIEAFFQSRETGLARPPERASVRHGKRAGHGATLRPGLGGLFVYQLKVALRGSEPLIWRRFQVRDDLTLAGLHKVLQAVMGWDDGHLHEFMISGQRYGKPDRELWGTSVINERTVKLFQVLPKEGASFRYKYDFGDNWQHDIEVERRCPPEKGVEYPVCLAGERACPPEDCGGIWGYAALLEAISNPDHPDHEERLEWLGGPFDAEAFDLAAVNEALRRIP